jgi:hydroxycarboxylate dehydrogenase B
VPTPRDPDGRRDGELQVLTRNQGLRVGSFILEALGAPSDISESVAGSLVDSDLAGHPSHGMLKLLDYSGRILAGKLAPTGRPQLVDEGSAGSSALVDGNRGFGQPGARKLILTLVDRLAAHPIAVGGLINASHTGRLGEWAELATANRSILLMFSSNAMQSSVAPYGGSEGRLGTNPMTFGVPGVADDRLILDFATASIAGGKLKYLQGIGEQAPPNSLIDEHGSPTTDPASLQSGGFLLPFGGHKGYGLSVLDSLLGGCVVAAAADDTTMHGVLAILLRPDLFAPVEKVSQLVTDQLHRIRSTSAQPGSGGVQVPGDYENANRTANRAHLRLPISTWTHIVDLSSELGIADEVQSILTG